MFALYFIEAILSEIVVKSGGAGKKSKKGWPYREARVF